MVRSSVESALCAALVRVSPPSDLAVEAMVAGVPVEETFPVGVRSEIVWPAGDVPGP